MKKNILLYQTIIVLLIIWLVNQIATQWDTHLDLTDEKRYTISSSTKKLLQIVEQDIFFEVYLNGDLPPKFQRLQNATKDMLDRFVMESGKRLHYKFTDPNQATSQRARQQFIQSLAMKGVRPTSLKYRKNGNLSHKIIIAGILASAGNKEVPINLLKGDATSSPDNILNQSIEGLEYELAAGISQLIKTIPTKIGLINTDFDPDSLSLIGLKNTILTKYELYEVSLKNQTEIQGYDAMVLVKPSGQLSENQKYLIDQYLMRGGSLLLFLDALRVNMDSALSNGTIAIPYENNLSDLLFTYGLRINSSFVLDANCGKLPVVIGNLGNQPQIQLLPWPYFPILTHFGNHPSVRNMDAVLGRFVSIIDTVRANNITKTPLIFSSPHSKILGTPVRVDINDLQNELTPEKFNDPPIPVAYLLEGTFKSLYARKPVPKKFPKSNHLDHSAGGKVILIADGDIVRNDLNPKNNLPLKLGVEPFTNTTYANETLLLNLLDYLTDDTGIMLTRDRELKIRPLNLAKIQGKHAKWQLINVGLPVLLLICYGSVKWWIRRNKQMK